MDISSEHIISSFENLSLFNSGKEVIKRDFVPEADSLKSLKSQKKRVEKRIEKKDSSEKQYESQVNNIVLRDIESLNPSQNSKQKGDSISDNQDKRENNPTEDNSKTISLNNNTFLQFELEEKVDKATNVKTKEIVVYLRDKETGEVIRRVPPEEYLDLYKDKLNMQNKGIFIDKIS